MCWWARVSPTWASALQLAVPSLTWHDKPSPCAGNTMGFCSNYVFPKPLRIPLHPLLTQPTGKPKLTVSAAQQGWQQKSILISPVCRVLRSRLHSSPPDTGTRSYPNTGTRSLPLLAKEYGNPDLSVKSGPHPIFISSFWHRMRKYISMFCLLPSSKHPGLEQSQRSKVLSLHSH